MKYWIFSLMLLFPLLLNAQETEKKLYQTNKIDPLEGSLHLDGYFKDAAWEKVPWAGSFVQHEPFNGAEPSQQTSFKVLYDDNNIYFAIKAHDSSPDSIVNRLTRRDDIDGDMVGIGIDSYFDKLTSFSFLISSAGVKMDILQSEDGGSEDVDWDAIWYAQTAVVEDGWNAEIKIPLSQLRFDSDSALIWGLEVYRMVFRTEEVSFWQHIPQNAPGFVHMFGELHGLKNIKPRRQVELAPYGVASLDTYEKETGNPYKDGSDFNYKVGLDGKIGITNNTILDFTVNPDFGQVEADASQVNLSAFETYYQEKRPFFIEGKNMFSFPVSGVDGSGMGSENLFYSRRIGRRPHGYPSIGDGEYAKTSKFTNILGAAKLTGKTKNGLSFGVLESVTAEEKAEIDLNGEKRYETVEPLTNYMLGRVKKEFNKGVTSLGGIITSTNRKLEDTGMDHLRSSAVTGGIDFTHTWKDKKYFFTFNNLFSHVQGSEEALLYTQTSSTHLFQRPDADYLEIDSSRTSLSGFGGAISFGKQGGGQFNYGYIGTWKSPSLELNDIGFLNGTDEITSILYGNFQTLQPFGIFRSLRVNSSAWQSLSFGLDNYGWGLNMNFNSQFKNYWRFGAGINSNADGLTAQTMRGGPMLMQEGRIGGWAYLNTDDRKKLVFMFHNYYSRGFNNSGAFQNYEIDISYRPLKTLEFSISPEMGLSKRDLQWVTATSTGAGDRYIFASINQKTLSFNIRADLNLTPNLSIQYWGQPFIASGSYTDFKRISDSPRDKVYTNRFHTFSEGAGEEILYNGTDTYYVNEAGGVSESNYDYTVYNPDFNVREFLSNLVFRWEYTPGSSLYLVWSQSRNGFSGDGRFVINDDIRKMFEIHPHNVFLVKLSYRFRR